MKESSGVITKKKKIVYSIVAAACALLLIAATVLTVYFVTRDTGEVLPPVAEQDPLPDQPTDPETEDTPKPDQTPDADQPTGTQAEQFVLPLSDAACTVEYAAIYTNVTLGGSIYRHMGVDFSADEGTPVRAIAGGVIEQISCSETLGNLIVIDHGDGLKSSYRFVEPRETLREGIAVAMGQEIGTVAAAYGTEYKDGTHLHFEMQHNGESVDPAAYLDLMYEEK